MSYFAVTRFFFMVFDGSGLWAVTPQASLASSNRGCLVTRGGGLRVSLRVMSWNVERLAGVVSGAAKK